MTKVTLQFQVDDKIARKLRRASAKERARVEALMMVPLNDWANVPPKEALKRIMDQMGATATARGLTDELLESILNED